MSDELRQLSADLGKASAEITRKAQRVVAKTAHDIEATAKRNAPVDTGALRDSISASITGGGMQAVIGPTVSYGVFVEFGTRRMRPQPYMGPALTSHEPMFTRAVESLIQEALW